MNFMKSKEINVFFDNKYKLHPYTGFNLYKTRKRGPVYPLIQINVELKDKLMDNSNKGNKIGFLRITPSFGILKKSIMTLIDDFVETIATTPRITHFPQLNTVCASLSHQDTGPLQQQMVANTVLKKMKEDNRVLELLKIVKIILKRNFNKVRELITGLIPFLKNLFGPQSIFLTIRKYYTTLFDKMNEAEEKYHESINFITNHNKKVRLLEIVEQLKLIPDKDMPKKDLLSSLNILKIIGMLEVTFNDIPTDNKMKEELTEIIIYLKSHIDNSPEETLDKLRRFPSVSFLGTYAEELEELLNKLHCTIRILKTIPTLRTVGIFTVNTYQVYAATFPFVKYSIVAFFKSTEEYMKKMAMIMSGIIKMSSKLKEINIDKFVKTSSKAGSDVLINDVTRLISYYEYVVSDGYYTTKMIKELEKMSSLLRKEGDILPKEFSYNMMEIIRDFPLYDQILNNYPKKKEKLYVLIKGVLEKQLENVKAGTKWILKKTLSENLEVAETLKHISDLMFRDSNPNILDLLNIPEGNNPKPINNIEKSGEIVNLIKLYNSLRNISKRVSVIDPIKIDSINGSHSINEINVPNVISFLNIQKKIHVFFNIEKRYKETKSLLKQIDFIAHILKDVSFEEHFKILHEAKHILINRFTALRTLQRFVGIFKMIKTISIKQQRRKLGFIIDEITNYTSEVIIIRDKLKAELYSASQLSQISVDYNQFANAAAEIINTCFKQIPNIRDNKDGGIVHSMSIKSRENDSQLMEIQEPGVKMEDGEVNYYYNDFDKVISWLLHLKENLIIIRDINGCDMLTLYRIASILNNHFISCVRNQCSVERDDGHDDIENLVRSRSFSFQNIIFKNPFTSQDLKETEQKNSVQISKKLLYKIGVEKNFDFSSNIFNADCFEYQLEEMNEGLRIHEGNIVPKISTKTDTKWKNRNSDSTDNNKKNYSNRLQNYSLNKFIDSSLTKFLLLNINPVSLLKQAHNSSVDDSSKYQTDIDYESNKNIDTTFSIISDNNSSDNSSNFDKDSEDSFEGLQDIVVGKNNLRYKQSTRVSSSYDDTDILNTIVRFPEPFCYLGAIFLSFIKAKNANKSIKFSEYELKDVNHKMVKCITDNITSYYLLFANSISIDCSPLSRILTYDIVVIEDAVQVELSHYFTDTFIQQKLRNSRKTLKQMIIKPIHISTKHIKETIYSKDPSNVNKVKNIKINRSEAMNITSISDPDYSEFREISDVTFVDNVPEIISIIVSIQTDLVQLNSRNNSRMKDLMYIVEDITKRLRKEIGCNSKTILYNRLNTDIVKTNYVSLNNENLYHTHIYTNTVLYSLNISYLTMLVHAIQIAFEQLQSSQESYSQIIKLLSIDEVRNIFLTWKEDDCPKLAAYKSNLKQSVGFKTARNAGNKGFPRKFNKLQPLEKTYNSSEIKNVRDFVNKSRPVMLESLTNLCTSFIAIVSRLINVERAYKISICDSSSKQKEFKLLKMSSFMSDAISVVNDVSNGFFPVLGNSSNTNIRPQELSPKANGKLKSPTFSGSLMFQTKTPQLKSNMSMEVIKSLKTCSDGFHSLEKKLLSLLTKKRDSLPRLFLLSDQELSELLLIGNMMGEENYKFVNLCFQKMYPGIENILMDKGPRELKNGNSRSQNIKDTNTLEKTISFFSLCYNIEKFYGFKSIDDEDVIFPSINMSVFNEIESQLFINSAKYINNISNETWSLYTSNSSTKRKNNDTIMGFLEIFDSDYNLNVFNEIKSCYMDLISPGLENFIKEKAQDDLKSPKRTSYYSRQQYAERNKSDFFMKNIFTVNFENISKAGLSQLLNTDPEVLKIVKENNVLNILDSGKSGLSIEIKKPFSDEMVDSLGSEKEYTLNEKDIVALILFTNRYSCNSLTISRNIEFSKNLYTIIRPMEIVQDINEDRNLLSYLYDTLTTSFPSYIGLVDNQKRKTGSPILKMQNDRIGLSFNSSNTDKVADSARDIIQRLEMSKYSINMLNLSKLLDKQRQIIHQLLIMRHICNDKFISSRIDVFVEEERRYYFNKTEGKDFVLGSSKNFDIELATKHINTSGEFIKNKIIIKKINILLIQELFFNDILICMKQIIENNMIYKRDKRDYINSSVSDLFPNNYLKSNFSYSRKVTLRDYYNTSFDTDMYNAISNQPTIQRTLTDIYELIPKYSFNNAGSKLFIYSHIPLLSLRNYNNEKGNQNYSIDSNTEKSDRNSDQNRSYTESSISDDDNTKPKRMRGYNNSLSLNKNQQLKRTKQDRGRQYITDKNVTQNVHTTQENLPNSVTMESHSQIISNEYTPFEYCNEFYNLSSIRPIVSLGLSKSIVSVMNDIRYYQSTRLIGSPLFAIHNNHIFTNMTRTIDRVLGRLHIVYDLENLEQFGNVDNSKCQLDFSESTISSLLNAATKTNMGLYLKNFHNLPKRIQLNISSAIVCFAEHNKTMLVPTLSNMIESPTINEQLLQNLKINTIMQKELKAEHSLNKQRVFVLIDKPVIPNYKSDIFLLLEGNNEEQDTKYTEISARFRTINMLKPYTNDESVIMRDYCYYKLIHKLLPYELFFSEILRQTFNDKSFNESNNKYITVTEWKGTQIVLSKKTPITHFVSSVLCEIYAQLCIYTDNINFCTFKNLVKCLKKTLSNDIWNLEQEHPSKILQRCLYLIKISFLEIMRISLPYESHQVASHLIETLITTENSNSCVLMHERKPKLNSKMFLCELNDKQEFNLFPVEILLNLEKKLRREIFFSRNMNIATRDSILPFSLLNEWNFPEFSNQHFSSSLKEKNCHGLINLEEPMTQETVEYSKVLSLVHSSKKYNFWPWNIFCRISRFLLLPLVLSSSSSSVVSNSLTCKFTHRSVCDSVGSALLEHAHPSYSSVRDGERGHDGEFENLGQDVIRKTAINGDENYLLWLKKRCFNIVEALSNNKICIILGEQKTEILALALSLLTLFGAFIRFKELDYIFSINNHESLGHWENHNESCGKEYDKNFCGTNKLLSIIKGTPIKKLRQKTGQKVKFDTPKMKFNNNREKVWNESVIEFIFTDIIKCNETKSNNNIQETPLSNLETFQSKIFSEFSQERLNDTECFNDFRKINTTILHATGNIFGKNSKKILEILTNSDDFILNNNKHFLFSKIDYKLVIELDNTDKLTPSDLGKCSFVYLDREMGKDNELGKLVFPMVRQIFYSPEAAIPTIEEYEISKPEYGVVEEFETIKSAISVLTYGIYHNYYIESCKYSEIVSQNVKHSGDVIQKICSKVENFVYMILSDVNNIVVSLISSLFEKNSEFLKLRRKTIQKAIDNNKFEDIEEYYVVEIPGITPIVLNRETLETVRKELNVVFSDKLGTKIFKSFGRCNIKILRKTFVDIFVQLFTCSIIQDNELTISVAAQKSHIMLNSINNILNTNEITWSFLIHALLSLIQTCLLVLNTDSQHFNFILKTKLNDYINHNEKLTKILGIFINKMEDIGEAYTSRSIGTDEYNFLEKPLVLHLGEQADDLKPSTKDNKNNSELNRDTDIDFSNLIFISSNNRRKIVTMASYYNLTLSEHGYKLRMLNTMESFYINSIKTFLDINSNVSLICKDNHLNQCDKVIKMLTKYLQYYIHNELRNRRKQMTVTENIFLEYNKSTDNYYAFGKNASQRKITGPETRLSDDNEQCDSIIVVNCSGGFSEKYLIKSLLYNLDIERVPCSQYNIFTARPKLSIKCEICNKQFCECVEKRITFFIFKVLHPSENKKLRNILSRIASGILIFKSSLLPKSKQNQKDYSSLCYMVFSRVRFIIVTNKENCCNFINNFVPITMTKYTQACEFQDTSKDNGSKVRDIPLPDRIKLDLLRTAKLVGLRTKELIDTISEETEDFYINGDEKKICRKTGLMISINKSLKRFRSMYGVLDTKFEKLDSGNRRNLFRGLLHIEFRKMLLNDSLIVEDKNFIHSNATCVKKLEDNDETCYVTHTSMLLKSYDGISTTDMSPIVLNVQKIKENIISILAKHDFCHLFPSLMQQELFSTMLSGNVGISIINETLNSIFLKIRNASRHIKQTFIYSETTASRLIFLEAARKLKNLLIIPTKDTEVVTVLISFVHEILEHFFAERQKYSEKQALRPSSGCLTRRANRRSNYIMYRSFLFNPLIPISGEEFSTIHDKTICKKHEESVYDEWQSLMMQVFIELSSIALMFTFNIDDTTNFGERYDTVTSSPLYQPIKITANDSVTNDICSIPTSDVSRGTLDEDKNFVNNVEQDQILQDKKPSIPLLKLNNIIKTKKTSNHGSSAVVGNYDDSQLVRELKDTYPQKNKLSPTSPSGPKTLNTHRNGIMEISSILFVITLTHNSLIQSIISFIHKICSLGMIEDEIFIGREQEKGYIIECIRKSVEACSVYKKFRRNIDKTANYEITETTNNKKLTDEQCLNILADRFRRYVFIVAPVSINSMCWNDVINNTYIQNNYTDIINGVLTEDTKCNTFLRRAFDKEFRAIFHECSSIWSKFSENGTTSLQLFPETKEEDFGKILEDVVSNKCSTLDSYNKNDCILEIVTNLASQFSLEIKNKTIETIDKFNKRSLTRKSSLRILDNIDDLVSKRKMMEGELEDLKEKMRNNVLSKTDVNNRLRKLEDLLSEKEEEEQKENSYITEINAEFSKMTSSLHLLLTEITSSSRGLTKEKVLELADIYGAMNNPLVYRALHSALILLGHDLYDATTQTISPTTKPIPSPQQSARSSLDVSKGLQNSASQNSFLRKYPEYSRASPQQKAEIISQLLSDPKLITNIISFDVESIKMERINIVRQLFDHPDVNKENIEKINTEAGRIFRWCSSVCEYKQLITRLKPLQIKLKEARNALTDIHKQLLLIREKKDELVTMLKDSTELICENSRVMDKMKSDISSVRSAEELLQLLKPKFEKILSKSAKALDELEHSTEFETLVNESSMFAVYTSLVPICAKLQNRTFDVQKKDKMKILKKHFTKEETLIIKSVLSNVKLKDWENIINFVMSLCSKNTVFMDKFGCLSDNITDKLKNIVDIVTLNLSDNNLYDTSTNKNKDRKRRLNIITGLVSSVPYLEPATQKSEAELNSSSPIASIIYSVELIADAFIEEGKSYSDVSHRDASVFSHPSSNSASLISMSFIGDTSSFYSISKDKDSDITEIPTIFLLDNDKNLEGNKDTLAFGIYSAILNSIFPSACKSASLYYNDITSNKNVAIDPEITMRVIYLLKLKIRNLKAQRLKIVTILGTEKKFDDNKTFLMKFSETSNEIKKLKEKLKQLKNIGKVIKKLYSKVKSMSYELTQFFITSKTIFTSTPENMIRKCWNCFKRDVSIICSCNKIYLKSQTLANDNEQATAMMNLIKRNIISWCSYCWGISMFKWMIYKIGVSPLIPENWESLKKDDTVAVIKGEMRLKNNTMEKLLSRIFKNGNEAPTLFSSKTNLFKELYVKIINITRSDVWKVTTSRKIQDIIFVSVVKMSMYILKKKLKEQQKIKFLSKENKVSKSKLTIIQILMICLMYSKHISSYIDALLKNINTVVNNCGEKQLKRERTELEKDFVESYILDTTYNETLSVEEVFDNIVDWYCNTNAVCDLWSIKKKILVSNKDNIYVETENGALDYAFSLIERSLNYQDDEIQDGNILARINDELFDRNISVHITSHSNTLPSKYWLTNSGVFAKNILLSSISAELIPISGNRIYISSRFNLVKNILTLLENQSTPRIFYVPSYYNTSLLAAMKSYSRKEGIKSIVDGYTPYNTIDRKPVYVDDHFMVLNIIQDEKEENDIKTMLKSPLCTPHTISNLSSLSLLTIYIIKDCCTRVCGLDDCLSWNNKSIELAISSIKQRSALRGIAVSGLEWGAKMSPPSKLFSLFMGVPVGSVVAIQIITLLFTQQILMDNFVLKLDREQLQESFSKTLYNILTSYMLDVCEAAQNYRKIIYTGNIESQTMFKTTDRGKDFQGKSKMSDFSEDSTSSNVSFQNITSNTSLFEFLSTPSNQIINKEGAKIKQDSSLFTTTNIPLSRFVSIIKGCYNNSISSCSSGSFNMCTIESLVLTLYGLFSLICLHKYPQQSDTTKKQQYKMSIIKDLENVLYSDKKASETDSTTVLDHNSQKFVQIGVCLKDDKGPMIIGKGLEAEYGDNRDHKSDRKILSTKSMNAVPLPSKDLRFSDAPASIPNPALTNSQNVQNTNDKPYNIYDENCTVTYQNMADKLISKIPGIGILFSYLNRELIKSQTYVCLIDILKLFFEIQWNSCKREFKNFKKCKHETLKQKQVENKKVSLTHTYKYLQICSKTCNDKYISLLLNNKALFMYNLLFNNHIFEIKITNRRQLSQLLKAAELDMRQYMTQIKTIKVEINLMVESFAANKKQSDTSNKSITFLLKDIKLLNAFYSRKISQETIVSPQKQASSGKTRTKTLKSPTTSQNIVDPATVSGSRNMTTQESFILYPLSGYTQRIMGVAITLAAIQGDADGDDKMNCIGSNDNPEEVEDVNHQIPLVNKDMEIICNVPVNAINNFEGISYGWIRLVID